MSHIFLHMGCNHSISEQAARETGVIILESMYAGHKLQAENISQEAAYFTEYGHLLEKKLTEQTRGSQWW